VLVGVVEPFCDGFVSRYQMSVVLVIVWFAKQNPEGFEQAVDKDI
jgi:hypothetical protein